MKKASKAIIISTLGILTAPAIAQTPDPVATEQETSDKAVIILDGSGSMWGQIDGTAKISIAKNVIEDVVGDWDSETELGLIAYGHRREGDCSDIEVLNPVGELERETFIEQVNTITPLGKTPISASLEMAADEVGYQTGKSSIILVSDGLETCDADPCAVASKLAEAGVDFKVHVVGFGVTEDESKQLQCIAENTGGEYLGADNAQDLSDALMKTAKVVMEDVPIEIDDVPINIEDLDLEALDFDVETLERVSDKSVATGTSNGVGWSISAVNIYEPYTNKNGGSRFRNLPGEYDDLHMGSDFTLTFERPISSLLVVLKNNDDTDDGPNFINLTPVDFVGASAPDGATQVRIDDIGGALFYYYDLNSDTLTHVNDNGINDGWDLAFFAFPAADE